MDNDLRIGNRDAIAVEDDFYFAVDVALDLVTHRFVAFGDDADDDRAFGEGLDADVAWPVDDGRAFGLDFLKMLGEDLLDFLDILSVADRNVADGRRKLGSHVDQGADVGVVDDLDVAPGIFDLGCPDAHFLDRPPEAVDDDDVADLEGFLEDDENPGEDVLDERLGPKADDEGEDPGAGQ